MSYKLIRSENDLMSYLNTKISATKGNVVIQAGHFALIYDENNNKLIPAINKDIKNEKIKNLVNSHPYMGDFPLKTWETALKLISSNPSSSIKVSIIVNDWQWVPKSDDGKENYLRNKFYENNTELPMSFLELLNAYSLSNQIVLPIKQDKINLLFFGEQKLRNKANRKYKDIDRKNSAISCAIGYLPFLDYVDKKSTNLLISFIPRTCKEAISYGTGIYLESNENEVEGDRLIINIFCDGVYSNDFFKNAELVEHK